MSAHTPGPWKVRKHWSDEGSFEVYPTRGKKPAYGQWSAVAEVCADPGDGESARKNANLIAAAPDLLEALKLVRDAAWPHLFIEQQNVIDAAIAKATGGAA